MSKKPPAYPVAPIESLIMVVRDLKIILDADLARIYGVPTKALNQAVKRNLDRFPSDFAFQVTRQEVADLRSQFVTSNEGVKPSQNATGPGRGGSRYLPYAFTEHGAIMAANVLNSPQAVKLSVFVVRAFVRMRQVLLDNGALAGEAISCFCPSSPSCSLSDTIGVRRTHVRHAESFLLDKVGQEPGTQLTCELPTRTSTPHGL